VSVIKAYIYKGVLSEKQTKQKTNKMGKKISSIDRHISSHSLCMWHHNVTRHDVTRHNVTSTTWYPQWDTSQCDIHNVIFTMCHPQCDIHNVTSTMWHITLWHVKLWHITMWHPQCDTISAMWHPQCDKSNCDFHNVTHHDVTSKMWHPQALLLQVHCYVQLHDHDQVNARGPWSKTISIGYQDGVRHTHTHRVTYRALKSKVPRGITVLIEEWQQWSSGIGWLVPSRKNLDNHLGAR